MSDTRVHGQHVEAFLESFGEVSPVFQRKASSMFEEQGIETTSLGDEWIRQGAVVAAVADLAEETGSSSMHTAGKAVGEEMPIEDASSATTILQELDEGHKAAFKDPQSDLPAGEFEWKERSDGTLRVGLTNNWPYGTEFPHGASFTGGILEGALGKTGSTPSVERTESRSNEAIAFEVTL